MKMEWEYYDKKITNEVILSLTVWALIEGKMRKTLEIVWPCSYEE